MAMAPAMQPTQFVSVLQDRRPAIPAEFRRRLGIDDDPLLQITLANGELRIAPVPIGGLQEDSDWLDALYQAYGPIWERICTRGIPEVEINGDIDAAIAGSRATRRGRP
jgi:hypothetical protein